MFDLHETSMAFHDFVQKFRSRRRDQTHASEVGTIQESVLQEVAYFSLLVAIINRINNFIGVKTFYFHIKITLNNKGSKKSCCILVTLQLATIEIPLNL